MFDLTDKIALITGATGGIGMSIAKKMKLSETFCQRLLHQSWFVDPNGFICNANFSFMKIRAAINVFAKPRRPICHHCAGCM